jgi:hypothetical protein
VDQWLIPEIVNAIKIKNGKIVPYQNEKEYLNNFKL